jgi:hypothetical protein
MYRWPKWYTNNWSLSFDLWIIALTCFEVARAENLDPLSFTDYPVLPRRQHNASY